MGNISIDELLDFTSNKFSKNSLKKVKSIFESYDDAIFYPKKSILSPDIKRVTEEFEENYLIFSREKIISFQRKLRSDVFKIVVYNTKDVKTLDIRQDQSGTRAVLTINFYNDEPVLLDSKLDSNPDWEKEFQNCITIIFDKLINIK
jgi:hypothetical protein